MTDIEKALDRLFVNAQTIINGLGNVFTSQEFLRRVIHDQQHAYIDLLVACRHLATPFDQAHQKIGRRLSVLAPTFGYNADEKKPKDENIFRLPTESVVYRRAK